jgi:GNAT superfamily N-acetyltransferase
VSSSVRDRAPATIRVVTLHHTDDAETYASAVIGFLEAEPCRRNVLRSVLEMVRGGEAVLTAPAQFWWATDGEGVVAAASWTPPYHLLVSELSDAVAAALVTSAGAHARGLRVPVPGVTGPSAAARLVAAAWQSVHGTPTTVQLIELLHQLGTLAAPARPEGGWRRAIASDTDELARWFVAFTTEAGLTAPPDPRRLVATLIQAARLFVWEAAGHPVSMAAHSALVAGVARVGPVYTPPHERQHGYARRLTYEVTREALDAGATRVILYTDTSNPTSNSIYRQIGYRPVEDFLQVAFPAGESG